MPDSSWTVADLVAQIDVQPDADGAFNGLIKFDEERPVVEGSQLLGQAITAAMRLTNGRRVISSHMFFARPVDARIPYPIALREVSNGRTMSAYQVEVAQNGKTCAAGSLLLDAKAPDVMRHSFDMPTVPGPDSAEPFDMGVEGRDIRVVDGAYTYSAEAPVGPPVIDAWVRLNGVPDDPAIHAGLLAQFSGHMSISAAMRPHAGIGLEQAHRTLSTGVNAIHFALHAEPRVDDWVLYHQHATFAGDGMTHSDCQVFSPDGAMLASFSVESMVRGFNAPAGADHRTAM